MKLIVAVAQYNVPMDIQQALQKLDEVAANASAQGARLVVAPETAIGIFADTKNAHTDNLPALLSIAKAHHIYVATSFYREVAGSIYNFGVIVSDQGEVVHTHNKVYLARPEIEEEHISAGTELQVSDSELGTLGMLICKDGFNKYSHFMYEKFNDLHTDIICIPTWSLGIWEVNPQEYIKSLFVYGAFASRSFVLMSGNLNKDTKSFGRSLIISPISGVIKEGSPDKEELLLADLDLDEVKKAREFDSWWQPSSRLV